MIDLIVAGGGPIGLAVAIKARLSGLDVLIVEPRESFIDKACGEGLMPSAIHQLQALGIEPRGIDFYGIRYIGGDRSVDARFESDSGKGVRRTELWSALHQRANELGVKWKKGKVTDLIQSKDWIAADGVMARYLIAADGLHSTVRSSLGLDLKSTGPHRYGLRQHFRVEPWSDLVEVHWLPNAEIYVTPVSENQVGIAVLGCRPIDLKDCINSSPKISKKLLGCDPVSGVKGAGPLRQNTLARTKGRALLVGDASGYVDALTGEGLSIGFSQASAAVSAILQDDLASYEIQWKKITRSYRMLTNSLLWAATHPPVRKLIVPAASAMPWVFKKIVDSLGK
jgi:flavin-dependent dehydrogenase